MLKDIEQDIQRNNYHKNDRYQQEGLEGSDQFDPLKSSELKKSHLTQLRKLQSTEENQQNQNHSQNSRKDRLLNIEPYSSRVSLHKQYPALSRELQQEEGLNHDQQQLNQQPEQVQFKQQKHVPSNNNEQYDINQFKKSIIMQRQKAAELPSEQKFEKYLNEQIGMLINDMNGHRKISQVLQSPILLPRNISQKSGDTSFYDPERYSLNLSRSYIPNFLSLGNPTVYQFQPSQSKQAVERKLKQIFEYYAETYLQPTKYYETFDSVKRRTMGFQSFCLFAKDFKILKTIFSLQTIKKVFKKQSQFGKVLQLKNFINLVEALSHEQQCNTYFRLQLTVPNMNTQTRQQLQTRELYAYMGLNQEMSRIREKFSKVFQPFGCKKDVELPRLKFNYRKFSEPDLHKKAIPPPKEKKKKSLIVLKSSEKYQPSPFDEQKSVVVSWSILKSKTAQSLQSIKFSSNKVKKYIKQDPEDKVYLKEYKQPKSVPRYIMERKITQIQQNQEKKPHKVIENLQKMEDNILAAKLKLQKKLGNNNRV